MGVRRRQLEADDGDPGCQARRSADYGSWRTVYDEVAGLRSQYGCTTDAVMRDAADPASSSVIARVPDAGRRASRSRRTRPSSRRWTAGGVIGPPSIEFYQPA